MTEKRLLALLALLIGLVSGLLILVEALRGIQQLNGLAYALGQLVVAILGVAILAASLLIYRGKYSSGGILDIFLGIVVLVLNLSSTGGILAIVAGVVGLVASETGP